MRTTGMLTPYIEMLKTWQKLPTANFQTKMAEWQIQSHSQRLVALWSQAQVLQLSVHIDTH